MPIPTRWSMFSTVIARDGFSINLYYQDTVFDQYGREIQILTFERQIDNVNWDYPSDEDDILGKEMSTSGGITVHRKIPVFFIPKDTDYQITRTHKIGISNNNNISFYDITAIEDYISHYEIEAIMVSIPVKRNIAILKAMAVVT